MGKKGVWNILVGILAVTSVTVSLISCVGRGENKSRSENLDTTEVYGFGTDTTLIYVYAGDKAIDTIFRLNTMPTLYVQGDNFEYKRKDGKYAPLGTGFVDIIAEMKPVIPLYRSSECKCPEDSITVLQYPFDKELVKRRKESDLNCLDKVKSGNLDGRYYYRYSSKSDTLMPLAWRPGSNIAEYLQEMESLIYSFPRLRFRVLELTDNSLKIVLNEENGKSAWIKLDSPEQIIKTDENRQNGGYELMRINYIPARRIYKYDMYYLSWGDYLQMLKEVRFKDRSELSGRFVVNGDTIRSKEGWKLWKKGDELLLDRIIEYTVE